MDPSVGLGSVRPNNQSRYEARPTFQAQAPDEFQNLRSAVAELSNNNRILLEDSGKKHNILYRLVDTLRNETDRNAELARNENARDHELVRNSILQVAREQHELRDQLMYLSTLSSRSNEILSGIKIFVMWVMIILIIFIVIMIFYSIGKWIHFLINNSNTNGKKD